MKHLFIVVVAFLLGTGCGKDNYINGEGDLGDYYMYFEFLQENDSSFNEGEIEMTAMVKGVNLQTNERLTYEDVDFYNLPVDSLASDSVNSRIFGPFIFSRLWEKEEEAGGRGNELFFDRYYLLRYNGTDIDTLRVRDSTKVGYYRHFSFYLNGVKQEVFGKTDDKWKLSDFYYIRIQKGEPLD